MFLFRGEMRWLAGMIDICKSDDVFRMVVKFYAASTVLCVNSIKKQNALFYDCPSFFGVNSDSPPDFLILQSLHLCQ